MTREPATTTRAVLMAAVEMRIPSERIEAILDRLLAAARAEALEEAAKVCDHEARLFGALMAQSAAGAMFCRDAIRALVKP